MAKDKVKTEKPPKEKKEVLTYYEAVGRRREATARVRLYVGADSMIHNGIEVKKGDMLINSRQAENYFPGEVYKKLYSEVFRTTNTLGRFMITVKTRGGGLDGQLDAVILGIARAIEKVDKDKYRPILKKRGYLTRDPRIKQRRKAGYAGKARAKKQSPKR